MKVYLDNAASTRLHPEVLEEMLPYLSNYFGNPSSIHSYGRKTKAAIENARKSIANHFNVSAKEIFFCASGTEANNIALKCSVEDLGVKRIISTKVEHKCVLNTVSYLAENKGVFIEFLKLDKFGTVDLKHLEMLLAENEKKTMVSIMHIQNELGSKNNLHQIGVLCSKYDALFHSDAVQSIGHYKIDLKENNIHFISASAHKFNGPLGIGFLYKRNDVKLSTWLHGGGHEKNLRSGTENVAGIIGMAKAIDLAYQNLDRDKTHYLKIRNALKEGLKKIDANIVFNEAESTTYTILSVSFPKGLLNDTFYMELDLAGIAVSAGSACSSGALNVSPAVKALDPEEGSTTLRFSFSIFNTMEEIEYVLDFFQKIKEKSNS